MLLNSLWGDNTGGVCSGPDYGIAYPEPGSVMDILAHAGDMFEPFHVYRGYRFHERINRENLGLDITDVNYKV